jgi:hypothetical protein
MLGTIRRLSVPQACLLGGVVAGLVACENAHQSLAPVSSAAKGTAHAFGLGPNDTVATFAMGIPDSGPSYTYQASTGIVVPSRKLHWFQVNGYTFFQTNPDYTCCFATPTVFPLAGQSIGPAGWYDSTGNYQALQVNVFQAGGVGATWTFGNDLSSSAGSDTELFFVNDSITAYRGQLLANGGCVSTSNGCPCPPLPNLCQAYQAGYYIASTNQVLSVYVASDPTLTLSPAVDTVNANTEVLFGYVVTPSSYGSTPYNVYTGSYIWTYNGDTLSCGPRCYVDVTTSGTVSITALVNGDSLTATASVVVR